MKKRLLALALCLVMLIGLIPAALADAAETPTAFTFVFDPMGGTVAEADSEKLNQTVAVGAKAQSFAISKAGYEFLGWKWRRIENLDFDSRYWNFDWVLDTQNGAPTTIKLVADWKSTSANVEITYRSSAPAAGVEQKDTAVVGSEYALKTPVDSWRSYTDTDGTEYVFEGWTGPDGTLYQPGYVFKNVQQNAFPVVGWTFVASYKVKTAEKATVTFRGENGVVTTTELTLNTRIMLILDGGKYEGKTDYTSLQVKENMTISDPTKDGMSFKGWKKTMNGEIVVLTAQWEPANEHTLTFTCWTDGYESIKLAHNTTIIVDPNGGSFVHYGTSYTTSKTFLLTADYTLRDATRYGYTFYGWRAVETGVNTVTFTAMWTRGNSSTYDVYYYDYTDSKYEYYRFDAGTYLVFDPNGGTAKLNNTSFSSQKGFYIYNDYTLSDAVRTGYTFYGWYLTKSGSTYTFTAMWSKSASTVPYMLNGEDHYAYIKGYPNGSFKPNATITRAEAASIFYRLLTDTTRKTYTTTYNTFKDVPAKAWYNTAVSTMAKLGIVNGDANGYFRPSDPITRAEIAAMIARCDGSYYGSSYTNFSDVKGHWASSYIARAYELGWINGYGTTYAPDKYISRAETVAILNRVLNRAPQYTSDLLSGRNTFSDVSTASWYYLDVEEAANSHTYTRKTSGYEYWNKLIADPSWL